MAEELEMLAHVAAFCSHSPSLSHSSRVASRLSDNQTLALRIRRVEPAINVTWLSPTRTMSREGECCSSPALSLAAWVPAISRIVWYISHAAAINATNCIFNMHKINVENLSGVRREGERGAWYVSLHVGSFYLSQSLRKLKMHIFPRRTESRESI